MRDLVIIGASGHGKVCSDVAGLRGYQCIRFLDDDRGIRSCAGYETAGVVEDYRAYLNEAVFFVAIGNAEVRQRIISEIENAGGQMVTLIHPNAVISADVEVGAGSVVMAGTVINSGTRIGKGVIVNTSSSIDHDCRVCDYCHISVGSHLCGAVAIGNRTWIGAGAVVSNNVNICGGCMIGAGAVVVKDIEEAGTYIGIPAKSKK